MTKKDRAYLREFIRLVIKTEIGKLGGSPTIKVDHAKSEYLSIRQCSQLFGISVRHIYNLRDQKRLTFHYLSQRKPFIRQTEIELLMQK